MPRKTDILRPLTIPSLFATINEQLAGLAHPVERLLPKQQAAGSGPVPCSKNKRQTVEYRFAFLLTAAPCKIRKDSAMIFVPLLHYFKCKNPTAETNTACDTG